MLGLCRWESVEGRSRLLVRFRGATSTAKGGFYVRDAEGDSIVVRHVIAVQQRRAASEDRSDRGARSRGRIEDAGRGVALRRDLACEVDERERFKSMRPSREAALG